MLTLVFGGSGSGKSSFAEDLAVTQGDVPRFYIATMQKDGSAEGQQRIEKHRKHRSGKGFETLEWERDLSGHLKNWKDEHKPCVFLLEDLGNLIANEMFSPEGALSGASTEDSQEIINNIIVSPLRALHEKGHFVFVVCDILDEDGPIEGDELKRYDEWMAQATSALARYAGGLVEVVAGIPHWIRRPE